MAEMVKNFNTSCLRTLVGSTGTMSPYSTGLSGKAFPAKNTLARLGYSTQLKFGSSQIFRKAGIQASPVTSTLVDTAELLDGWDDDYGGVVIYSESLPSNANAFKSSLRSSLSYWKSKGKKGVWLKIQLRQSELVPLAIQEGFDYHHAEPGSVMLTYWIPNEPCTIPAAPCHHIGIGGFVMNEKREVLVVKEKCPRSCSEVWKLPTGYINNSEDILSGAVREVKEETGVDTTFLKMVAFRHCHFVAFEKSDLLFVCVLRPLSSDIAIDENEIQAAKWMPFQELVEQPFYEEDHMLRRVIEICVATNEDCYSGFVAHQLTSKLDGKLSFLYYDDTMLGKKFG
ncbi:hypothetical protein Droror1_Dr00007338 [Drosera rotundifolia]